MDTQYRTEGVLNIDQRQWTYRLSGRLLQRLAISPVKLEPLTTQENRWRGGIPLVVPPTFLEQIQFPTTFLRVRFPPLFPLPTPHKRRPAGAFSREIDRNFPGKPNSRSESRPPLILPTNFLCCSKVQRIQNLSIRLRQSFSSFSNHIFPRGPFLGLNYRVH